MSACFAWILYSKSHRSDVGRASPRIEITKNADRSVRARRSVTQQDSKIP